ncbi:tRNA-guanine transglycosylase DpdA [Solirubrobacter soli]|uniref:tRNA-guanine transglycosylase DpdA n=1 Tax=Solirubrobacter soli TaxID=363832 RepID=UPI00040041D7|nr:tRNA-guanine transglycosylase DpdA [Solirubrobacter soli]
MRFYFPDSQDQVDPSFDFLTEERSPFRIRQRDDLYAHEVLDPVPYTGMLVSKAMVDGVDGGAGRYSAQQRQRLYRVGIREFFRLNTPDRAHIETMGDCGAFTYVREDVPPYSVDDVIDFYEGCGFDAGISLDHVILGFELHAPLSADFVPEDWSQRRELTLQLAADFLRRHAERGCSFQPVGVAQGWSPESYAASVEALQKIGYGRIALGGMVAQKTHEILAVLHDIDEIRDPATELHLLGITRTESIPEFASYGVTSFDSTSPFRQAFKDDRDNYHADERTFLALRVPQAEGNVKLQRRIRAGEVDGALARRLERRALDTLRSFDAGRATVDDAVEVLRDYERLHDGKRDRSHAYREVLESAPWKSCECAVCRSESIEVIIFRGTERNKRRGFHNLTVFARRLERQLGQPESLVPAGA